MNSTKRSFVKAGAIIAIISAVSVLFSFFSLIPLMKEVNENLIKEILIEENYVLYEELDGGYYLEHVEEGKITDEDIEVIVTWGKGIIITLLIVETGISIAMLVLAVLMLKNLKKDKTKKAQIIALLVLSAFTGTTLTLAFMIVALCIKDKKVTLENINEIAKQTNVLDENLEEKQNEKQDEK